MRFIRIATLMVCALIFGSTAFADDPVVNNVDVDLGVADPATPRTYAVQPGKFEIKLTNVIPNKKYEVFGRRSPGGRSHSCARESTSCDQMRSYAGTGVTNPRRYPGR